jgi:hypothetical protein
MIPAPAVTTTPLRLSDSIFAQNMQFEDALKYIYDKFRCLFFHEGLLFASYHNSKVDNFEISHVVMFKKHLYFIDLKKIVSWLSKVVKESLYCYLIQTK